MAPRSRFGASKYRNATPYVPPREEWYRSHLPAPTASSTSTFSNEIKTNSRGIVTLTPSGDFSFRGYDDKSTSVSAKFGSGGGVGDWDLSRLQGGGIVVGGMDGGISLYNLPVSGEAASPVLAHTITSGSSPITNLILHPTTPDILLASSIFSPLKICDLSSSALTDPVLELKTGVAEPRGLWSTAWSADGRLVACLGKSGVVSTYDPRAGKDPLITKNLSFSIQSLKPGRIAWVGDDIFLASYSKTRNRQYSLLSPNQGLSTLFTSENIDTSPNPLIPLVDEERRIVYLAGKGDMTIRQIEISSENGLQETLHPLPSPLTSQGLALVHPLNQDVMKAEIAKLVYGITDKDGEALLPIGIRVPRRQLIDYHDDLFPDVKSNIPEQTASDWLNGEDRAPLFKSLDPSRRGDWEKEITKSAAGQRMSGDSSTSPIAGGSNSTPAPTLSAKTSIPATSTPAKANSTPLTPVTTATTEQKLAKAFEPKASHNPSLPSLERDETYSATSYKVRLIADHIADQLGGHRATGKKTPLFVGLQGPQGCGKTTLCTALVERLRHQDEIKAAVLSLDDLYKTHAGLQDVAQQHPDNALLSGRGPPGTHDTQLANDVLQRIQTINDISKTTVQLPIFDKSLCGGEGDRSSETVKIQGPLDVFILEGWSMGFMPLEQDDLEEKYEKLLMSRSRATTKYYCTSHPFSSIVTLNNYLEEFTSIYKYITTIISIQPTSYEYVFGWRLEQELSMKKFNGGRGMSDEQVRKFVERYMPGYELWSEGIWAKGTGWEGNGLRIKFGEKREVLAISRPNAKVGASATQKGNEIEKSLGQSDAKSLQTPTSPSISTTKFAADPTPTPAPAVPTPTAPPTTKAQSSSLTQDSAVVESATATTDPEISGKADSSPPISSTETSVQSSTPESTIAKQSSSSSHVSADPEPTSAPSVSASSGKEDDNSQDSATKPIVENLSPESTTITLPSSSAQNSANGEPSTVPPVPALPDKADCSPQADSHTNQKMTKWTCAELLRGKSRRKCALIIVNQPIRKDLLDILWDAASLKLCADGGANRLYDADSSVRDYYETKQVRVIEDKDEYSTDLMKCIEEVPEDWAIVMLGGLSGRVDQTVHTMSMLYRLDREFYVLSEESMAWILRSGTHEIVIDHERMGQTCGILPIGIDSAQVKTKGLKWDTDWTTSITGNLSTSNHLLPENPTVWIETDKSILWTVEIPNLS